MTESTVGAKQARDLAEEGLRVIATDRQSSYGHPTENFGAIAYMIRGYVLNRFGVDLPFDGRDVPNLMILTKVAREGNQPKADNVVDIIGYAGTKVMEHVGRTGEAYPS